MTTPRFTAIVGLIVGAVGVFAGFGEAVTVAFMGVVGFVIGLALDGRLDASVLSRRDRV